MPNGSAVTTPCLASRSAPGRKRPALHRLHQLHPLLLPLQRLLLLRQCCCSCGAACCPLQPLPHPRPAAPKAAKPEAFKSSITSLANAADGRFIATLENGEQWLQSERDPRVEVKVGDTVTLQPGMFGSWTTGNEVGLQPLRVKPGL